MHRWLKAIFRQTTQNGHIDLDRVQWTLRAAHATTFPGLFQESPSPQQMEMNTLDDTLRESCYPKFVAGQAKFAESAYKATSAKFDEPRPIKPQDRDPAERKSIRHFMWPQ